jgi:hypothetical protein
LSDRAGVLAISAGGNQSIGFLANGNVAGQMVTNFQNQVAWLGEPPDDATNLLAIAAGLNHSLAIRADRTVIGWGQTNLNQLGIPAYATNVIAVAPGGLHNVVLVRDPSAPPIPPRMVRPPLSRGVFAGRDAVFHALAIGGLPLHYQWYRGAVPLDGQTNSWLWLKDVHLNDAGGYHVVASNEFGAITSAVATVTVAIPPPTLVSAGFSGEAFTFSFHALSGVVYVIEYSDALEPATWHEVEQRAGTGQIETISAPSTGAGTRFYRVRAVNVPDP